MLIIFIGKKKEKTAKGKPKKNLKIGMAVAVLWVQVLERAGVEWNRAANETQTRAR